MPEAALKKGETRVAFGDVVRQVRDRVDPNESGLERFVAGEHMDTDELRIRRWGTIGDGYLGPAFHMRFKPGHVLYGSRRTYLRKVAVADFEGITANTTFVIESKDPQVLLPDLLPFIMQTESFHEHSKKQSKGSVNPYVNFSDLTWYEFTLPPLEEQRRILEVLNAAHDHLLAATDLRRATKRLLQSLQKRYFIEAPEGVELAIGEFAEVRNGTTPRRNREDYWGGQVPWLPTGKVNERRIRSADEFITEKALDECSLSIIPRGATLVAMIGEGQTRGRAAFLETDACVNQNFGAVVPNATVDPAFVFFLLESQYEALRHWSQGTNQHALNCSLIRSFRVRMPGLERQRELTGLLTEVDTAAEHAAAHASEARVLFNTVSGRAFGAEAA